MSTPSEERAELRAQIIERMALMSLSQLAALREACEFCTEWPVFDLQISETDFVMWGHA